MNNANREPRPEIAAFEAFLKRRGLSSTRQRALILEQVFKNHSHFDADELVASSRKASPHVSRATVYRTLAHMEESGLVRKVDLGHGRSRYEHVLGHQHHEHLCCLHCGVIEEFTDPVLEGAIASRAETSGFAVTDHSVQIFGFCRKCATARKGPVRS